MIPTEDYITRCRNDPRTTEDLLNEAALAVVNKDNDDGAVADSYWDPIFILHCRADDTVMAAARKLLVSEVASDRAMAADILAQVAVGKETLRQEAADLLLPLFESETNTDVLNSLAFAFAHLGDPRAIPWLIKLSGHSDDALRYAVVNGLSNKVDPRAIASLIILSSDTDLEVRNWATFGLGSLTEVDTPELRNALLARLDEAEDEIRGEALVGLARCGDLRIIPAFLKELESDSPENLRKWCLITDAARGVVLAAKQHPNPQWHPLLERLKALKILDPAEL